MVDTVAEFVPLTEAARRLRVSDPAMRRRVRDAGVTLWSDPADFRRRMIRIADLDRLAMPRPIAGSEEAEPMTA